MLGTKYSLGDGGRLKFLFSKRNRVFVVFVLIFSIFYFKVDSVKSNSSAGYERRYLETNFYKSNKMAQGSNPFDIDTTIKRLHYFYSANPWTWREAEKNILQIGNSKLMDEATGKKSPFISQINKWKELNPNYEHKYIASRDLKHYLEEELQTKLPEVVGALSLLPETTLQDQFGSYIWIFMHGGLYADIDIEPIKPIDDWLKDGFQNEGIPKNLGFVSGIELDQNFEDWETLDTRRIQLSQWTFVSKKGHPILARLIANIVKTTFEAYFNGELKFKPDSVKDLTSTKYTSIDVKKWTGPTVFTDSIFDHLNSLKKPVTTVDLNPPKTKEQLLNGPKDSSEFSWKKFTANKEVIIADDVAILPLSAFKVFENCERYCFAKHSTLDL